jgi:hypothetical protein
MIITISNEFDPPYIILQVICKICLKPHPSNWPCHVATTFVLATPQAYHGIAWELHVWSVQISKIILAI